MEMESKLVYYVGEPVLIITDDPEVFHPAIVRHKHRQDGQTFYIIDCNGTQYARYGTAIWLNLPHEIIDELVNI